LDYIHFLYWVVGFAGYVGLAGCTGVAGFERGWVVLTGRVVFRGWFTGGWITGWVVFTGWVTGWFAFTATA